MTTLKDIRTAFVDFFAARGHAIVPSSPLVPRNDPTLLFTNAGMVQFKNVFTGAEKRPYNRAVSVQKCVRAGGKHNDLDNVGYTARHHTFFEMLGNFSFGDYFKEDAIRFAWELVTKVYGVDPKRLLVTVYPTDETARGLWRKIAGIEDARIIGHESNLWAMGPLGPCGFCSEIFIDQGPSVPGGPPGSADEDGDRFLEFWNLVFMQFEQVDEKTRIDLPRPSIDTGMGLERIAAILQGVTSNYQTDLFRHLMEASASASGAPASGSHAASHRVIADHLRASAFLIADGILPSNEGRGYVLRRIMRRAMRHAHILGAKDPLLHRLVPVLVSEMGQAYSELQRASPLITETLKLEETRFRSMLERGLRLLDEETSKLSGQVLPGDVAFKLYDTFGFPLDLTQDALRARNLSVNTQGFDAAMAKQKAEARASWAGSGEAATEGQWFALRDRSGASEFLGYDTEEAEGVILALVKDGQKAEGLSAGETGLLVANQTPFYGEAGGQAGDRGTIRSKTGAMAQVNDTQKRAGDLIVHEVTVTQGRFAEGEAADFAVDHGLRTATRANHSATHLLHEALRRVLGSHVTQKGSLVAPDRLRFDFSHTKAVSEAEIEEIERLVNAQIRANEAVSTKLMQPEAAIEAGAMALFGEKYGEEVRVLAMGGEEGGRAFSVELCGGTHVTRTGDIALMKITGESAVASGVRRIEALTGAGAFDYLAQRDRQLKSAALALKTTPADLPERLATLVEERRRLERELADAKRALALGGGTKDASTDMESIGPHKLLVRALDGVEAKELRAIVDEAKAGLGSGVAIVGTRHEEKAAIAVGVTSGLTAALSAVDLIRLGVETLGGKGGGGRPDMAQAGGPLADKLDEALSIIAQSARAKLGAG